MYFCLKVSVLKDDDDCEVNGEVVRENEVDKSTTEQTSPSDVASRVTSALPDDDSDVTNNDFSLRDGASPLPVIRAAQRQNHGRDDNDDDAGKLDDIYDFELSEDQRQALHELFHLKLDLGFTAG